MNFDSHLCISVKGKKPNYKFGFVVWFILTVLILVRICAAAPALNSNVKINPKFEQALKDEKELKYLSAVKLLESVVAVEPKNLHARTALGRVYIKIKKTNEGVAALQEALKINPKFTPAFEELSQYYESTKNYYEFKQLYVDTIKKLGEKPEFTSKLCEISYLDAVYDDAISMCKKSIDKNKNDSKSYVFLAQSYKEMGNVEEAEKYLKLGIKNFPRSPFTNFYFGQFFYEKKDYKNAYIYFKKAAEIDKKSSKALVQFAQICFEMGKYDEALVYYTKACLIDRNTNFEFRKAVNTFRIQMNQQWLSKYETEYLKCPL